MTEPTPAEPEAIRRLRQYANKSGYLNAKQIIAHIDALTKRIAELEECEIAAQECFQTVVDDKHAALKRCKELESSVQAGCKVIADFKAQISTLTAMLELAESALRYYADEATFHELEQDGSKAALAYFAAADKGITNTEDEI